VKDFELRLTRLLAQKADEADIRPVDGFAESPYKNAALLTDPDSVTERRHLTSITPGSTSARRASSRLRHAIPQVILAVACAAVAVAVAAVVSRNDAPTAVDTPVPTFVVSPLEEPSSDEAARASVGDNYPPGSGATEMTAARRYVSLRRCSRTSEPGGPCEGSARWAYATGSSETADMHFGLLGIADDLVLSALDDRYFVASARSGSPAWLIDSVTGQRGALRWDDEPTTLHSAEQQLVLPRVRHLVADSDNHPDPRSLPLVVDKRDWTIGPLSVPEDASSALTIHQPGTGRIWIGTAPNDGDVGLLYSDDGGESWTDVELPDPLRLTSDELLQGETVPSTDRSLVVAASGDHVAVTARWDPNPGELFVSGDAGENWDTVALSPIYGSGRGLYVLSDDRLLLVSSRELGAGSGKVSEGWIVSKTLRVSSSASDWSRLERSIGGSSDFVYAGAFAVDVNQQLVVVAHGLGGPVPEPMLFSTDLRDLWGMPDSYYLNG
jgi:hypothetical protein